MITSSQTSAPIRNESETESATGPQFVASLADRQGAAAGQKKICIVCNNIYPMLTKTTASFVGGAEVQQAIIGRALRDHGHQVSYVTLVYDEKRNDEVIDGMRVLKAYAPEDGLPGLRAISPRLTTIWQALKRADAEVYYQRCADRATGIVALFCRKYGRTFVHSGASDSDFYSRPNVPLRERIPYLWGLRHADVIIVQSGQQNTLLKENFSLTGHVLPNVYPERPLTTAQGYVLWVGNMRYCRRPLLALEVARQFPNIQFIMIGGIGTAPEGSELFKQVEVQCPANVDFLGYQPLEVTEKYFDGASLFLSTSSMEGFPNTYLQAWSRGIPTVGYVDPDHVVTRNQLGRIVCDGSQFGDWFDRLRESEASERIRIQKCFNTRFSPQLYVTGMIQAIESQL